MSDPAAAGSVDTSAQQTGSAGNPDNANATVLNGSENGGADWWAGLQDEGNRKLVEAKGWNSKPLDEVLSSYRQMESKFGEIQSKAIVKPGENASPEEWSAYYAKHGRPEKPEGYQFRMPDGHPEDIPYDAKFAEIAKSWFHEAGADERQAQTLHDKFVTYAAEQHKAAIAKAVENAAAAHRAIVEDYGDPESDGYKRSVELADRASRKLNMVDSLKRLGAIGPNGEVMDAGIFKALVQIGKDLYAEDALHGGPRSFANNPFKRESENLTEQGKVYRSDPELALAMIRNAGRENDFAHLFPK